MRCLYQTFLSRLRGQCRSGGRTAVELKVVDAFKEAVSSNPNKTYHEN